MTDRTEGERIRMRHMIDNLCGLLNGLATTLANKVPVSEAAQAVADAAIRLVGHAGRLDAYELVADRDVKPENMGHPYREAPPMPAPPMPRPSSTSSTFTADMVKLQQAQHDIRAAVESHNSAADVDAIVLAILETHDMSELWEHARRDPEAFRNAVRAALAGSK